MTAPTLPDAWTLVARAQAGDMDAFADIYRAHHDRVFRFLAFRLGVDLETANDLTQDVFVRALRGLGAVTWQGKAIEAWLLTIARNLAADHFRSSRVRTSSMRTLDDLVTDRCEPAAADDPEADAEHTLEAEAVQRLISPLLAELTPDQLRVLVLRFYGDLSVAETAAAMGLTVTGSKALQYRACQSLRRGLRGVRP